MFVVALGSIIFLLLGSYLSSFNLYPWDGGLLIALGLVGLTFSLGRLFFPQRRWWRPWNFLSPAARTHSGIRAGSLVLSAWVGWMARRQPTGDDFTFLLFIWVAAVAIFALTLLMPQLRNWRRWVFKVIPWGELGLLLLAALLVRVVALGRIPANFGGDEGTQAALSLELVSKPLGNPFATGWYSVPTFSFLLYGLGLRLGGATMAGARLLSALVGTLTVLTTWLWARALGWATSGLGSGCGASFFRLPYSF